MNTTKFRLWGYTIPQLLLGIGALLVWFVGGWALLSHDDRLPPHHNVPFLIWFGLTLPSLVGWVLYSLRPPQVEVNREDSSDPWACEECDTVDDDMHLPDCSNHDDDSLKSNYCIQCGGNWGQHADSCKELMR